MTVNRFRCLNEVCIVDQTRVIEPQSITELIHWRDAGKIDTWRNLLPFNDQISGNVQVTAEDLSFKYLMTVIDSETHVWQLLCLGHAAVL